MTLVELDTVECCKTSQVLQTSINHVGSHVRCNADRDSIKLSVCFVMNWRGSLYGLGAKASTENIS